MLPAVHYILTSCKVDKQASYSKHVTVFLSLNCLLIYWSCQQVATHQVTLAFPSIGGVYVPKQENEFVYAVLDELEHFLQRDFQKSMLLFPPLPSRLRYLIHKTTEKYPNLATFSVGEDWCKRVVVCYYQLRYDTFKISEFVLVMLFRASANPDLS